MTSSEYPQIHGPGWHEFARTPVVDGKYIDPQTGATCNATGSQYSGPPAVDIIINSIEEKTMHCGYRAARPFSVEAVLWQIMKIVHEKRMSIDSLTATTYTVRLLLAHEMTPEEFSQFTDAITNGLFDGA